MPLSASSEAISFESEGVQLRGELLKPDGPGPHPAIVATHGFGFVQTIFLDHNYPQVFQDAGYAVLVYDHRGTGISEGDPRQELDPVLQQRGYQDAITFLCARNDIDIDRIGIWGTSYSGGHVLGVAANDSRVRCVVSQVMTISGRINLERRNSPEQLAELRERWATDRLGRFSRSALEMIDQVGRNVEPEKQSALASFISSLAPECLEHFDDRITLRTLELYNAYEPGKAIEHISPTPLLMIVCAHDKTTFADLCLAAYERARQPKKLIILNGDHFAVYRKHFEETSAAASDWFDHHMGPGTRRSFSSLTE